MENKKVITSGDMTKDLIGNWLLWGILYGFIYSVVFSSISTYIESIVLKAVVAVIIQGVIAIMLWKSSTSSAFKKRTISYNDVPKVMKNLVIFTIIICIINAAYNIVSTNSSIDKAIKSNSELKYTESIMSSIYTKEEIEEYKKEKEKIIEEEKRKSYMYVIIMQVGLTAVYLGVLPLEKKEILKYVSYN